MILGKETLNIMTTNQPFNVETFPIDKFDAILNERGLSNGLGKAGGQICIEAAICEALGLDHGDDPGCVAKSVRSFKISLNDKKWSSPQARAKGLRDLGLAQLGSLGTINDIEFVKKLAEKLIRILVPTLIRELYQDKPDLMQVADRCEAEGTRESALAAKNLLRKHAAYAASYAADAADAASYAADAAYAAPRKYAPQDRYLSLGAKCALEVLIEMKSPGCALLGR
jgi:hypothetical protein